MDERGAGKCLGTPRYCPLASHELKVYGSSPGQNHDFEKLQ